jgi:hypothetical protein
MNPLVQEAIAIIISQTGLLKLTRPEHIQLQQAINIIEDEIRNLSPKPATNPVDPPVDNIEEKAIS